MSRPDAGFAITPTVMGDGTELVSDGFVDSGLRVTRNAASYEKRYCNSYANRSRHFRRTLEAPCIKGFFADARHAAIAPAVA
jgi:hypothetical protein